MTDEQVPSKSSQAWRRQLDVQLAGEGWAAVRATLKRDDLGVQGEEGTGANPQPSP